MRAGAEYVALLPRRSGLAIRKHSRDWRATIGRRGVELRRGKWHLVDHRCWRRPGDRWDNPSFDRQHIGVVRKGIVSGHGCGWGNRVRASRLTSHPPKPHGSGEVVDRVAVDQSCHRCRQGRVERVDALPLDHRAHLQHCALDRDCTSGVREGVVGSRRARTGCGGCRCHHARLNICRCTRRARDDRRRIAVDEAQVRRRNCGNRIAVGDGRARRRDRDRGAKDRDGARDVGEAIVGGRSARTRSGGRCCDRTRASVSRGAGGGCRQDAHALAVLEANVASRHCRDRVAEGDGRARSGHRDRCRIDRDAWARTRQGVVRGIHAQQ